MTVPHFIARQLIGFWLRTSPRSFKRRPVANDSPHVHAPGINPDRVLLVGDGVASGRGVLTHDLGLPGFLARGLSAMTGHATDVDIIVDQEMTVRTTRAALDGVNLSRFDTIILSVGQNEALALMPIARWCDELNDLLDDVERRAPAATPVSVLAIPALAPRIGMPEYLASAVNRHARALNEATAVAAVDRPNLTLIDTSSAHLFEPENTHVYKRWADHIAAFVSSTLGEDRAPAADTAVMDEMHRQLALQELEASGASEDTLDDLVAAAQHIFGTPIAAVTFVHSDYQSLRAVAGMEQTTVPRGEAFCNVTIRRASHLVIEDARADSRYADYSVVTGDPAVRFYAGYPIESPDGHRVGAFCVMDTAPRSFTQADLSTLRSMAQRAENRLWPGSEPRSNIQSSQSDHPRDLLQR